MAKFDVMIAGELNLDLILYGLPETLPPERELLAENMMLTLGSSSAIVAHNLAALGSRVGFVSCIGGDSLGDIALQRLSASGVHVEQVIRNPSAQTGLTVILQHGNWRNILTYPGTIFDLKPEHLDFQYLSSSRHFHFSSFYLQRGLRPHVTNLFQQMKQSGLTISLDPNDDPDDEWKPDIEEVLRYVDIFLPNAREAKKIAGTQNIEDAISKLAAMVPLIVVKRGAEGAMAQRGSDRFVSPAANVEIVDPVGAGDSFDAGFLHQYLRRGDLQSCLNAGNVTAALSTTRAGGTEAFRDSEYRNTFLENHR
ncbi:MAG: carbohydrate kinase family protein [Candidatus Sulfotelmatobacter sp.]